MCKCFSNAQISYVFSKILKIKKETNEKILEILRDLEKLIKNPCILKNFQYLWKNEYFLKNFQNLQNFSANLSHQTFPKSWKSKSKQLFNSSKPWKPHKILLFSQEILTLQNYDTENELIEESWFLIFIIHYVFKVTRNNIFKISMCFSLGTKKKKRSCHFYYPLH